MADRTDLARQIIDQWPSDDGSADEAGNYFDFGLWKQTSQPLQRRGTILPFGQYEDGSIAPAWPAALADPYEAAVRGLEGPDAVRPEDALIAAGGAALGGIPFAAKGAVGSAGGRLMQSADLPPAAVNALTDNTPTGIRAYHGSPHDFDRFSLDKIGTGEGAQAYGHGLYFAENEGVARSYRDALSPNDGPAQTAQWALQEAGNDTSAAIEKVRGSLAWKEANGGISDVDRAKHMEAIKRLEGGVAKGRMYEVNIKADPEQFLDWDLPLFLQSSTIKEALRKLGIKEVDEPRGMPSVEPSANGKKWTVRNVWGDAVGTFATKEAADYKAAQILKKFGDGGAQLAYQKLGGNPIYSHLDKGAATQALREAGIPGIRYLDQGSRAAGEGSRNYVVFDDNLIDILRKYANAPTGAPFALAGDEFDIEGNALMDALRRRQEVY